MSNIFAIEPMEPEKLAYALARYSRSPDSVQKSIDWVISHDSSKFLESFYFQYGHASIADLGHVAMCFEGISELAATEIEDEQLWDGQARSSRYQDFSHSSGIIPQGLTQEQTEIYTKATQKLLDGYKTIHKGVSEYLKTILPCPVQMKPDAYERTIAARAFDVARYLLFLGIPTGVGQVTSIRTLEKQIRRLKSSEYANVELRDVAEKMAKACSTSAPLSLSGKFTEPLVPTLAKYVDPDTHLIESRNDLKELAKRTANVIMPFFPQFSYVTLNKPVDVYAEIIATLLYPHTPVSFKQLYQNVCEWDYKHKDEVIDVALRSRVRKDDLLRNFRNGTYCFDIVMDIGAYRDLHRHRRCQQFRQAYTTDLGYEIPEILEKPQKNEKLKNLYTSLMDETFETMKSLPEFARDYLLPLGTRSRFLFKMDFAEVEYITRLRSGVKGHSSYREIAWMMANKFKELEPDLGRLLSVTPPWEEDPLTR